MQQRQKHESLTSSSPQPIVVVRQATPEACSQYKGKGYYADNLAFTCEDEALLATRSARDVYLQLSHPVGQHNDGDAVDGSVNKWFFWKAVVSGSLLAASILILYLWIHIRYINPMLIEIFKISPPSQPEITVPKISNINLIQPATVWTTDYDVPTGIPVIKLHAKYMTDLDAIDCPPSKFALVLHIESDSDHAENWLKACGHNVAYFRIDGDQTPGDVDRLLKYLKDAQYLPLKATLKVEKGGDLLDNPDFQKTRTSDEVIAITHIEISGYVTPQTIDELVDAVPYAEELTITEGEVCKSLRRSLKSSEEACKISWPTLQKLHIFNTKECSGMYDLIYSCWDMPKIEILQIRKSIITDVNSAYISSILNRNRITHVDFADNSCFDETPQIYPFMCQSSFF